MSITKLLTLILVPILFTFILPARVASQDQEWCLGCHQYPGLVKYKATGKLKVLHIDEQAYLASTHGKLHCTACHQGVDKIPHVGANKTDCQSQCHQTKDDQSLLAKTAREGFHRKQQSMISRLVDRSSCKVCHPIYPHKKEPFVRAFLNMHTGYLVCEVCHLKQGKNDKLVYQWVDTKQVKFEGTPFGSQYDPQRNITHKPDSILSRIAPFAVRKGQAPKLLMNTSDTTDAIKYQQKSKELGTKQKRHKLRYYHRDVVKMAHVKACETCHASKGLLDFRNLGFSQKRSKTLISMPIGNIIKKYEVFYLPKLNGM